MVAYEKHGVRFIDMSRGIGPTAEELLRERVKAGYWYDDGALKSAQEALGGTDPRRTPWHFLFRRRDYEYERVEIANLEEIT